MPQCSAFNCRNRGGHLFPKDPIRRKLWEEALRIKNFKASDTARICSLHFKADDYIGRSKYTDIEPSAKFLKKTAVPSIFCFTESKPKTPAELECKKRYQTRKQLVEDNPVIVEQTIDVPKDITYKCSNCKGTITGFRYTCVQCADWDLCGACEARAAHAAHYVLRVPGQKPHDEIQTVLAVIRKQLQIESLSFTNEITIEIKVEPKEDSDPEHVETEPAPDVVQEFARNMVQVHYSKSKRPKVVDTNSPRPDRLETLETDKDPTTDATASKLDDTRPKSMNIGDIPTMSGNTPKKTLHVPSKLKIVGKGNVPTRLKPIAPGKVPRELIATGIDKVLSRFKRKSSNSMVLLRLPPGSDPKDVIQAMKSDMKEPGVGAKSSCEKGPNHAPSLTKNVTNDSPAFDRSLSSSDDVEENPNESTNAKDKLHEDPEETEMFDEQTTRDVT